MGGPYGRSVSAALEHGERSVTPPGPGSPDDLVGDAVPELGRHAEGGDVDALVVAVEALPERFDRHLRREQRGAVGDGAPGAVEAGVRSAGDDPRHELGARV